MKILALDSSLLVLRSKEQARKILESVQRCNAPLEFSTKHKAFARFTPERDGSISVWEPDTNLGTPIELQPSTVLSMKEAVNVLFTLRKYYNVRWRELDID
jgi:hypothetical protein